MYSFWKSFQVPGNDWPLAFCDYRTIDYSSETITADVVFPDKFTENERVYYSPKHHWYYFKDLGEDEAIMFRQTDTQLEGGGGKCSLLSDSKLQSSIYQALTKSKASPIQASTIPKQAKMQHQGRVLN